MTVEENGSLGLTKKAILKQMTLSIGLTDEQVTWIKNKIETVEAWKNTAVTKLTNIETQGVTLANRITALEGKVTVLETKATAAQVKFVDIEKRLKALEL